MLCVGEVLWDALPAGLFLGGAPFNVACHLRAAGESVAMVSRVGADHPGGEALRRMARYGVSSDLVQVDSAVPTGLVRVTVDKAGNAEYEIVEPAAWDGIVPTKALLQQAAEARAIVFGLHVNRGEGLTIAVSQQRSISEVAKRTVVSDDALGVLVPVLEEIAGYRPTEIRALFDRHGFVIQEWEKVRTDWLTIREHSHDEQNPIAVVA